MRAYDRALQRWVVSCCPITRYLTYEQWRLELTPMIPLFGHRTTRQTHWCGFMKEAV